MFRRLLLILTLGSIAALVWLNFDPVTTKLHRIVILGAMVGVWAGPLLLLWKRKVIRYILLPIPLLIVLPFLLPGKTIDQTKLRDHYLENMIAFQDTPYHWGGENARGIDCSGLPRKSLRNALFTYGIKHHNGRSLRLFLKHWWDDASAKALSEGHLDFAKPIGEQGTIAKMEYKNLQPGDFAITEDKRHLIVFLGGEKWIQADPGAGKVITENARTSANGWFAVPVTIHRWTLLERGL